MAVAGPAAGAGKQVVGSGGVGARDRPGEGGHAYAPLRIPLVVDGETWGALVLSGAEGSPADEVARLDILVRMASLVLHRIQVAEALRESELIERASRFRLTTILESVTDAFFMLDPEWRFTYLNDEAERLLRSSRDDVLGRNVWQALPETVGSRLYDDLHRALGRGEPTHSEIRLQPLDIWADVRAYPSAEGLSVFLRDISERKRTEEELRESERVFRAFGNSLPQLAWSADPRGSVTWYNQRWYDYTGTVLDDVRGWGWTTLHHPEHVDRVVAGMRAALETGEPWEDTFPLRSRTGEYRWFLSRAVPFRDAGGKVVRWFGTNTDVTERIAADAERQRLLEAERRSRAEAEEREGELTRVTESRARLLRGFSHDLKNPLGAADGYLELLEDGVFGALEAGQADGVRGVRESIGTALRLIEDLLAMARAESGELPIRTAPMDVRSLVSLAAEEYRSMAEAKGLGMRVDIPHPIPPVEGDEHRVRQVLGNLLSNAVKYTDEGGIVLSAAMQDREPGGPGSWLALSVADTGRGIPEGEQEFLFQEFHRLGDRDDRSGAGIGLAISRHIADALGGDITVRSETGVGSTFTLWLPSSRTSETRPPSVDALSDT